MEPVHGLCFVKPVCECLKQVPTTCVFEEWANIHLNQNHSGPNIQFFFPEATVETMLYFRFNLSVIVSTHLHCWSQAGYGGIMNDDSLGNIGSNILDRFHQLFMQSFTPKHQTVFLRTLFWPVKYLKNYIYWFSMARRH